MADDTYSLSKELAQANQSFYLAFESLDYAKMRQVWLDDDVVKCVHPGGEILIGRGPVLKSWQTIFANTHSIRVEVSDLQLFVSGDFGWVSNVERLRAASQGDGVVQPIAATNLYVRHEGQWRLVLHHASAVTRRFGTS